MASKIAWYIYRLKSMSLPEVLHRFKEQARRRSSRKIKWQDLNVAASTSLQAMPVDDSLLRKIAQSQAGEWRRQFEKAQHGDWFFLGRQWPSVPLEKVWHLDPVSGQSWSNDIYCFDINYRHRQDRGDIKYLWEVNRLQILPMIAALARVEKDSQARTFVLDVLGELDCREPTFQGRQLGIWN